jgi:hypothetical protein
VKSLDEKIKTRLMPGFYLIDSLEMVCYFFAMPWRATASAAALTASGSAR